MDETSEDKSRLASVGDVERIVERVVERVVDDRIAAREHRLIEAMRGMQTEILGAFDACSKV